MPRYKRKGDDLPPPTREFAKKLWFTSGQPAFRPFAKMLEAAGYGVDTATLIRWAQADAEWSAAVAQNKAKMEPKQILKALKSAKDDSAELSPEVFLGVKAQLVARLYESIKTMAINNVEDWYKALDACDRIEALIHAERGKALAKQDSIATPRGAIPSIAQRLNPPVALATFKKPNGNGAA